MKVRSGFVSNSSSSSYLIVVKKDIDMKEKIKEVFEMKNNVFSESFSEEVARLLCLYAEEFSFDRFEEVCYLNEDTVIEKINDENVLKNSRFFSGNVTDESDGLESYLTASAFEYNDDDIFLYKEEY